MHARIQSFARNDTLASDQVEEEMARSPHSGLVFSATPMATRDSASAPTKTTWYRFRPPADT